jgi:hypothetical protein
MGSSSSSSNEMCYAVCSNQQQQLQEMHVSDLTITSPTSSSTSVLLASQPYAATNPAKNNPPCLAP